MQGCFNPPVARNRERRDGFDGKAQLLHTGAAFTSMARTFYQNLGHHVSIKAGLVSMPCGCAWARNPSGADTNSSQVYTSLALSLSSLHQVYLWKYGNFQGCALTILCLQVNVSLTFNQEMSWLCMAL